MAKGARTRDEFARPRQGLRFGSGNPLAPGPGVIDGAIAQQSRLVDRVVEDRFVEIEYDCGRQTRQRVGGNAGLFECRTARIGRRDPFFSLPVDLLDDGAIFGRHLHP
jgi:hypothetical protein